MPRANPLPYGGSNPGAKTQVPPFSHGSSRQAFSTPKKSNSRFSSYSKTSIFYKTNARSFILISQLSKKTLKNGQFQRYKRLSCLQVPFEWRRTFSLKLLLTSFAASNLSIYRHSQGIKRTQNCQIKKDQVIPV